MHGGLVWVLKSDVMCSSLVRNAALLGTCKLPEDGIDDAETCRSN
jgi:hypothetical protein